VRFAVAALVLLAAGSLAADDGREEASAIYRIGVRSYDLGEYAAALEAFKRSYLLSEAPELLFNIGQCHRKLGHDREALDFYKRYLQLSGPSADRESTLSYIAAIEGRPKRRPPVYKRWWLWTLVGVVLAGGVTAAVIATTPSNAATHDTSLGTVHVQF
jgi:tetratricopeptide (TPR) repeat protein